MQTLILVPTRAEMDLIFESQEPSCSPWPNVDAVLCGFGQLLTGMNTLRLLMAGDYDQCLLVGHGGCFNPYKVPIGQAVLCRGFHQYGFGFCEDGQIRSYAQTVVASLIDAEDYQPATLIPQSPIGDALQVVDCLSVFSASGDAQEAENRCDWFRMDIEEMEGYGAALACRQMNVPFGAIRGITNQAGDRDHANWKMNEAADAIREALQALFANASQA
ncbi:MAG: hypothetical protein ACF8OB_15530 [Phycisphaeraceae bacterium JB051]